MGNQHGANSRKKRETELPKWTKADCLGCEELVRRHTHAWVELAATSDGSWIVAIETSAGQSLADTVPDEAGQVASQVGFCHAECIEKAYAKIRAREVVVPDGATTYKLEILASDEIFVEPALPSPSEQCPFCGRSTLTDPSEEDIYPRWPMKEYAARGAVQIKSGFRSNSLRGPTVVVCSECNNTWMSVLENNTKPLILKLSSQTTQLTPSDMKMLATWATLKAFLFDLAVTGGSIPSGFLYDLRIKKAPSSGVHVWVAAYSDRSLTPSSQRDIWHDSSAEFFKTGVCITFAIARVAVQVLVPFHPGRIGKLADFGGAVFEIFPQNKNGHSWPPRYYLDLDAFEGFALRINDGRMVKECEVRLTEITRVVLSDEDEESQGIWLDSREVRLFRERGLL